MDNLINETIINKFILNTLPNGGELEPIMIWIILGAVVLSFFFLYLAFEKPYSDINYAMLAMVVVGGLALFTVVYGYQQPRVSKIEETLTYTLTENFYPMESVSSNINDYQSSQIDIDGISYDITIPDKIEVDIKDGEETGLVIMRISNITYYKSSQDENNDNKTILNEDIYLLKEIIK